MSDQHGRMLHLTAEPHRCKPPHGRDDGYGPNLLLPSGPSGSVWRCTCGRLWVSEGVSWSEAGLWLRWRWRKAGR